MRTPILPFVILAGVLGVAGCGTSYYPPPNDPVLIANSAPPAEIRAAVIRAYQDRRYVTEQEEAGRITARHEKGEYMLKVAVEYDGQHYQVRLLASSGYKTMPGPDGSVTIESRAAKEIKALVTSIDREIARPAKEAAEAKRHEEEYRMMLEQQKTARAQANAQTAQANLQTQQGQQQQQQVQPLPVPVSGVAPVTVQSQTSVTSGSQSITCCINGAFYNCPSQDAFRQCMGSNPSACTRDTAHSCK